MSRNFMRERLERRIVEINCIIADRLADAIENMCHWTTEEIKNNNELIESLQDERRDLRKLYRSYR